MSLTEQLAARWQQIPESDRRALTLGGFFLVVVFGYIGVVEPVLSSYEKSSRELAELQDRQIGNARKIALLPKREARLAEYRAQRDALEQRFQLEVESVEQAVSRTIAEITYYARLSDVEVSGVRPQTETVVGEYTEIPFELSVRGDYNALRKFIYYVDTSPSVLAATRLQLKPVDETTVAADVQIIDVIRPGEPATDETIDPRQEQNQLRLAIPDWPGYWPVWVAQSEGYFDSTKFSIEFVNARDKTTLERLMLSGQIDGLGLTLADLLAWWTRGLPLKVTRPLSVSTGAEAIVASAEGGIQRLADLTGQRVGVDEQGLLPYVFDQALQRSGLSSASVTTVPREAGQVAREIRSGLLRAGVTREPWLSGLIADGSAIELFRTDDQSGDVLDVMAIYTGGDSEKTAAMQFFIDALDRAERYIDTNREAAISIFTARTGVSVDAAEQMLARLNRYNSDRSLGFYNGTQTADRLADFVRYFEQTDQPVPLLTATDILAPDFVRTTLKNRSNE